MNIQTERTNHKNQPVIKLLFDYDVAVVAKIRTVQGVHWSRTMRCWYVADQPQKITALQNIGIAIEKKMCLILLLMMLMPIFWNAFRII